MAFYFNSKLFSKSSISLPKNIKWIFQIRSYSDTNEEVIRDLI